MVLMGLEENIPVFFPSEIYIKWLFSYISLNPLHTSFDKLISLLITLDFSYYRNNIDIRYKNDELISSQYFGFLGFFLWFSFIVSSIYQENGMIFVDNNARKQFRPPFFNAKIAISLISKKMLLTNI